MTTATTNAAHITIANVLLLSHAHCPNVLLGVMLSECFWFSSRTMSINTPTRGAPHIYVTYISTGAPPGIISSSSKITLAPSLAAATAAGIPAGPAPTTITSQCNSGNLNRDLSWVFIASFAANMETPGKAAPAAPIPMFFKNCLLFIVIVVRLFLF